MINFLSNNISKFIKEKLTKSEYNYKLIDIKQVNLEACIELENSKLNPPTKGLLLDESKGKFEEIDLDSDSNYNKIKTHPENLKTLELIHNYTINYSSWFDYLKKIIFGNRNQEYLNNFFKFFQRNRNLNETYNNNFCFNCDGKFIGFINKEGKAIISDAQSNDSSYIINIIINSFAWDSICPNKLFFSVNNILYECAINEKLYINKLYSLSKLSKFINCFPSPKGDLIILLYEKGIEVYDIFQNILFSKFFTTFKFINALYDYKSSVFIVYTENRIIIFNLNTFDFKPYTYFPGSIIKIISNLNNDNIYIFVIDKSKASNGLLMFTLSDISITSDINLNFNSYQNYDNFYRHYHYVLRPDIISFQHNLKAKNSKVLDICLSPNDFRIGILYEEELSNQIKQNSLYIYGIIKDKRDNTINKIIPFYNFGHIEGSKIVSFEFNKILNNGNSFLVVRFENDNFIKTENING